MNRKFTQWFSLALALLMTFTLVPSAAHAAESDESAYSEASVEDILIKPQPADGHVLFGEKDDVAELSYRGESNTFIAQSSTLSVEDALADVCTRYFNKKADDSRKDYHFDYISYASLSAVQGTLYNGYNTEGDTGAGVAGTLKYYYKSASGSSNMRISDIRFVPKTSFSGEALITYYGYYYYMEKDGASNECVRQTGSYSGRIDISVTRQVPGISYTPDRDPARFPADDFDAYCSAVTGRTFRYITFKLPETEKGTLYYNYISPSVYDFVIGENTPYFRTATPSVDKVYFVPAKDYAGKFTIAFTGVDSAGSTFDGAVNMTVSADGPGHSQPRVEGTFVYEVKAGRSITLDADEFQTETNRQLSCGVSTIRFAALPDAGQGILYDDSVSSGSNRTVTTDKTYSSPGKIRFAAASGYSGVVALPIVVTGTDGTYFDTTVRFVITDSGNVPLTYKVEPGGRVSFIESDFVDACYEATGYKLNRIHFDALPSSAEGTIYYNGNQRVTTGSGKYYYVNQLSDLSFLAADAFVGSVDVPFVGYACGYSSSNGRSFAGTITIQSNKAAAETPAPIGGESKTLTYYTNGTALTLRQNDILNVASPNLPGAPVSIQLSRPADSEGRLCLDFHSLSDYTPFDHSTAHTPAVIDRTSYVAKAGFSGNARISYTVRDAKGNSYGGNIVFVVTPPTSSSYFTDMADHVWAIPAVDFFRYYGTTVGTSANSFDPDAGMRRADFLLLLSRAFSFPTYYGNQSFDDVEPDRYYAAAVASAKALGIVEGTLVPAEPAQGGTGSGSGQSETRVIFRPDDAITREDAALYLYRALLQKEEIAPGSASDLSQFPDGGTVSDHAREAMGALVRDGVFQGYVHNLLPKRTLSRAETITILYRALT